MVNTEQNKLGEERIYLTLLHCSLPRTGAPVRNLEVGTGTETVEEHCLLAYFLGLAPLVRIQPEPPAVGGSGTAAQCAGPSNMIRESRKCPMGQ